MATLIRSRTAQRCRVRLHGSGDELSIIVTDDGSGIPGSAVAGVGLSSIRERVDELGGCAVINVRLPLGRAAA